MQKACKCSCVTGRKGTKLTTYAQFCFKWGSGADKINAATPFRVTEILGLSKYIVPPILPLNDMYSLLSSNSWLIPLREHLWTSMELCQFIHAQMLISIREYSISIQWQRNQNSITGIAGPWCRKIFMSQELEYTNVQLNRTNKVVCYLQDIDMTTILCFSHCTIAEVWAWNWLWSQISTTPFYGFYHCSHCSIPWDPYTQPRSQWWYIKPEVKDNHCTKELKCFCSSGQDLSHFSYSISALLEGLSHHPWRYWKRCADVASGDMV